MAGPVTGTKQQGDPLQVTADRKNRMAIRRGDVLYWKSRRKTGPMTKQTKPRTDMYRDGANWLDGQERAAYAVERGLMPPEAPV